jgi:hypothetical protein
MQSELDSRFNENRTSLLQLGVHHIMCLDMLARMQKVYPIAKLVVGTEKRLKA